MKLKNDQIKLLADTVKGVGVAWIVGGIIAPLLRVEGPFPYIVMVVFGIGFGVLCVSAALFILTFWRTIAMVETIIGMALVTALCWIVALLVRRQKVRRSNDLKK